MIRRILFLALLLHACADAPSLPTPGADGAAPEPRDPAEVALKAGLRCNPRSADGYRSGAHHGITVVDVDGRPVEINTAARYLDMQADALADGVALSIVSGFRTMEEQRYLYGCYVHCDCNGCNLAASPGYSNHQSGLALDLNTSDGGVYDWLSRNAARYGFHRTVPSEDWHWEYLDGGTPGAGLCDGHGDLAFVGLRAGGAYRNGIWLKAKGTAHHVRYFADEIFLGASEDAAGQFPVRVSVSSLGARTFVARGYDDEDELVSEARVRVEVTPGEAPRARLAFASPRDGGAFSGGLWLKLQAPADTERVVYSAGARLLGESAGASQQFAFDAQLTRGGWRVVQAVAYRHDGSEIGRAYSVFEYDAPEQTIRFDGLADGQTLERTVNLVVRTAGPVARVSFHADQWKLGEVAAVDARASLAYTFQQTGRRVLRAVAWDPRGVRIGTATATVVVGP